MKPHPAKFVKKVHQYIIANPTASDQKVAKVFKIAHSTVRRWRLNVGKYGTFGPYRPGKNRYKTDRHQEHIVALVKANPTITTLAIQTDLQQTFNFPVAEATIGTALIRYGIAPPKLRRELTKLAETNATEATETPPVKAQSVRPFKLASMEIQGLKTFVARFYELCGWSKLEDNRGGNALIHGGYDVLFLSFCACLAGQTKYKDMVLYCENNWWFFQQFMDLPATMCNPDTLRRVLGQFNPKPIRKIFYKGLLKGLTKRVLRAITLDGKIIRGSGSEKNGIPKIGIASAVSHNGKLVIDSVDFQFGEEVEAIRTLLRSNDFKGLWVTADALHCNRKTVDLMHQRMVRYCLRLRNNQKKLYQQVQHYLEKRRSNDGSYSYTSVGHGRVTIRTVECYHLRTKMQSELGFPNLKMVVVCKSYTLPDETETRVYLLSQVCKPELAASLIQNHWCVESLHWELDTNLREDEQQAIDQNAVSVLSVLTRAATNMIRIFNANDSNRAVMKRNSFNPINLIEILTGYDADTENYMKQLKEQSKIDMRLEN